MTRPDPARIGHISTGRLQGGRQLRVTPTAQEGGRHESPGEQEPGRGFGNHLQGQIIAPGERAAARVARVARACPKSRDFRELQDLVDFPDFSGSKTPQHIDTLDVPCARNERFSTTYVKMEAFGHTSLVVFVERLILACVRPLPGVLQSGLLPKAAGPRPKGCARGWPKPPATGDERTLWPEGGRPGRHS